MLTVLVSLVTLPALNAAPAKVAAPLALPAHPQFYEILMNPPGSSDDAQGREYITLRGPANMSLDTYAIVVVENEHSSGGANNIGSVDTIIPLDGYSTNADGICLIRDLDNTNALGDFSPSDTMCPSSVAAFQFQDDTQTATSGYTYSGHTRVGGPSSLTFGGNSLENEGGNFFLVRYLNKDLEQEIDGVSTGTTLDIDHDGILDYLESTPPVGWIQPWDNQVIDCVFIPVKDKALGTNASTQQLDYTAAVSFYTHISQQRQVTSTADWFARFDDANALVTDLITNSGVFNVDSGECYFTDALTYGTVVADFPYTLSAIKVRVGMFEYFGVADSVVPPNRWTH